MAEKKAVREIGKKNKTKKSFNPRFCDKFGWQIFTVLGLPQTTYSRNNMRQKCGGDCGLWILNEIIKKIYPENMKKIVGAVWELPAK